MSSVAEADAARARAGTSVSEAESDAGSEASSSGSEAGSSSSSSSGESEVCRPAEHRSAQHSTAPAGRDLRPEPGAEKQGLGLEGGCAVPSPGAGTACLQQPAWRPLHAILSLAYNVFVCGGGFAMGTSSKTGRLAPPAPAHKHPIARGCVFHMPMPSLSALSVSVVCLVLSFFRLLRAEAQDPHLPSNALPPFCEHALTSPSPGPLFVAKHTNRMRSRG